MAEPRSASEDRLLKRLRYASAITSLVCIVLLVVVDTFGRLFIDPAFHVSEVIFGTLMGALVAFVGVEALVRLPKKNQE